MFENQNASSSPEPRGRSPAGSSTSDNSRPTSKVRASFVSVVPHSAVAASPLSPALTAPKEFGTAKGTGSNTGLAQRRESFSISGEAEDVQELKKVISEEKEERKKSVAVAEAIPEQAVESRVSGTRVLMQLGGTLAKCRCYVGSIQSAATGS